MNSLNLGFRFERPATCAGLFLSKTSSIINIMNQYVKLAIDAINEYVLNKRILDVPEHLPQEMLDKRAGVFVSIHKITYKKKTQNDTEGELRGCIGTIMPTKANIAQEIINNAIAACSQDYRFEPVKPEEIEDLEISVDVLSEPECIAISDMQLAISKLDVKKYGVIVKSDNGRTGLLLPDLEGVDTLQQQIAIARQKAGISPDEPINIYRFEVIRYR